MLSNLLLYVTTTLIWGSTWLAIQFQLGKVPPLWSISYRFGLASAILFVMCRLTRRPMQFSLSEHRAIGLQGLLLFSLNYILFYLGSAYLISGLVAIIFAIIMILNIINSRLFLKTPISPLMVIGAIIGLCGLAIVFSSELSHMPHSLSDQHHMLIGLGLCIVATYIASLGNIVAKANQDMHLPIMQTNAYGMAYGAIFTAILAMVAHQPLVFDWSTHYIGSLLFLAIVGSVLAFNCYLKLIGKIGPARAAYIFVILPIIAMLLSTAFEGFEWHYSIFVGIGLVLLGNILVMKHQ